MRQADLKKAVKLTDDRNRIQTALAYLHSGKIALMLGDKAEFRVELHESFKQQLIQALRQELMDRDNELGQQLKELGIIDA